jgi:hypothetical protein
VFWKSKLNIPMDYDDDEELDNEVNDIISQIKNQSKNIKQAEKEKIPLNKEDISDFIIQNAANIVGTGVEIVEELKREILAGADSKLIESYSELIRACNSGVDILLKFKIAEDKNKNQKEIAQMNIDAKITKSEEDENTPKLTFTRNDILKLLEKKEEPTVLDV